MATKRKPRRRLITNGAPSATFSEWATWVVRGIMVGCAYGVWSLLLTIGDIKTDIAVIKQQVAAHGAQLQNIWQRLPH